MSLSKGFTHITRIIRKIATLPILAYRHIVSPWLGANCIYHPTCSQYAEQAVLRHGVLKGVVMALARVTRCAGGLFTGGEDAVPERFDLRELGRNYGRFRRRE